MNLTRWNPFRDIEDFFNSYQRLLPHTVNGDSSEAVWAPSVDITENDKEFLIKAELPEVAREDIHIELENGVLTLSGERKHDRQDEKLHRTERFYGFFSRSFAVPENVNAETIDAEHRDGMLYLHLPKTAEKTPAAKSINIH